MEVRRWGFGEGSRPEPVVRRRGREGPAGRSARRSLTPANELGFTAAEGAAPSRLVQSQTAPAVLPAYLITHLLHILMTD